MWWGGGGVFDWLLSATGSPWQQTRQWNRFSEARWITCARHGLESGFPTDLSPLLQDLFSSCGVYFSRGLHRYSVWWRSGRYLYVFWDFRTNPSLSWTDPRFPHCEIPQPPQRDGFCETPTPGGITPNVSLRLHSCQRSEFRSDSRG